MRHHVRVLIGAGLLAGALHAPASRAADVSAQQADALQRQLRDWLSANLGQAVLVPGQPPEVRADGDHFAVAAPLQLPGPPASSRTILLANARQAGGGAWDIDSVPSNLPVSFTLNTPVPNEGGRKGPPRSVPVTYTITTTGQSAHARLDPSFATPSTLTASSAGMTVRSDGGPVTSMATTGPATTVSSIQPAGPGLIDLSSNTSLQRYETTVQSPGVPPVASSMDTLRTSLDMKGVNRDQAAGIMRALVGAAAAGLPAGPPGSPAARKALSGILAVVAANMQGLATSAAMTGQAEGVKIGVGDVTVNADGLSLGLDANAEGTLLRAGMGFGLHGVSLANAPLGPFGALIPRSLAFRFVVSGLKTPELRRILAAVSRDQTPDASDAATLADGARAGIEGLTLEVGGATFAGEGHASMAGPGRYAGLATVSAENFDELIQTVNSIPLLQQAIPALAFLKGIGRSADGRTVWTINADDAKVLVNGIDIGAMAGAMKPRAPAPTPRPRQG